MAKTPARALSLKQAAFVAALVADPHAVGKNAALAAGYSQRHAADAACRLMQSPLVKAAIDAARSELIQRGVFNAEAAMALLVEDRNYARSVGQANAAVKATENMMRLHGLITEQIRVEKVDLGGALIEAKRRADGALIEARRRGHPEAAEFHQVPINPFDGE